ncbi:hypothetical protein PpBr36_04511 [Pyricularia pennisetigena]|uniref:hypothetical protein n=1 Tax=Pyricularia pennisetigena TaxID=1578925 RepID=UPI0011516CC1|nr:hypothetical protein PpBr36_04511 [Pyricularia pennisetigena]TLS26939.1 hypothetical protein PpBr36_04511 [Pyricularia pennisetigena]
MNSQERWVSRQQDPRAGPGVYDPSRVLDRLHEPSIILSLAILLVSILYTASISLPSFARILWNGLVTVTPARLIFAVDGWINPPLFPRPEMLSPAAQPSSHAAKSEALRRILGVDSGATGLLASVSQVGRRMPGFGGGGIGGGPLKKTQVAQPAGLGNISNSCYQNSILQGLAALKPLPAYLNIPTNSRGSDSRDSPEKGPAATLRDLIAQLNDADNNGRTLWTPAVLKNMSTWTQQDASEYYHKLLDEVDEEITKAAQSMQKTPGLESLEPSPSPGKAPSDDGSAASLHSEDSGYHSLSSASKISVAGSETLAPRNPLLGLQAQRVACVSCGWSEGLSMIPFNSITLSLGMGNQNHDLYERLDAYTSIESIPGVECGKCTLLKAQRLINTLIERSRAGGKEPGDIPEAYARIAAINEALEEDDFDEKTISERCKISQKVNSMKTKQLVIARAPQSLAIHMNRSVFDERTGQQYKNFSPVRFPAILDLGPWCLGSAEGSAADVKQDLKVSSQEKSCQNEPGTSSSSEGDGDFERWLLDPKKSMVAGDGQPSRIVGPIYELRAVVTHQGRHENGHYICYRKHPRPRRDPDSGKRDASAPPNLSPDGEGIDDTCSDRKAAPAQANDQSSLSNLETLTGNADVAQNGTPDDDRGEDDAGWWRLSDQNVARVSEEVVMAQGGVFMLFYDCVDPIPVLTSDADADADADAASGTATSAPEPLNDDGEVNESVSYRAD